MSKKSTYYILFFLLLMVSFYNSCQDDIQGSRIQGGALKVTITTEGADQDRDGYALSLDMVNTKSSDPNDIILFPGLEKGEHTVKLDSLAHNCSIEGENPQTALVTLADTTSIFFNIKCEEVVFRNQIVYDRHYENNYNYGLFVMDDDGSNPAPLTTDYSDSQPNISPDGTKVAFSRWTHISVKSRFDNEIYIITASGNEIRRITNSSGFNDFVINDEVSWSPDGQNLIFTRQVANENHEIMTIKASRGGLSPLTDKTYDDLNPSWSPDGSKIVFSSNRQSLTYENYDIYVMDADGSNEINLTDNDSFDDMQPSWSPDGSQITFISFRDGEEHFGEVYLMNNDGGNVRRLTFNANEDSNPKWSPDGQYIIFSQWVDGNWEVVKMKADGSNLINITETPEIHEGFPHMSPVPVE